MFLEIHVIEWIGYVGSILVALSLTMSSLKKLRWYNLVGAAIFSTYGFIIAAYPVALLNLFIVLADIFHLYKMYAKKETFNLLEIKQDNPYLHYFIATFQNDIQKFFPEFNILQSLDKQQLVYLLIRNGDTAGIFYGIIENAALQLYLDYVTPPFRDLKPGNFIYEKSLYLLKKKGIKEITCKTENPTHQKYLLKMGYYESLDTRNVYIKKI